MAAQYVAIKRISSLDTPITAEKLDGSLFTTENQAHEFIVSVRKNGVKQTVTGSVSGKFIRANGTTIFLQGSIVDGDAVVRLHQDCYNVQGRFTFNIFNTQSGVTTCIYSAVGKMDMGSTETVIDAGDVVPDISDVVAKQEEMTQVIADARTATTAANTAAQNVGSIVAEPYSPPYKAGERCTQNGNLYKAKQDIPSDEEWTASHWTQIVVGDEVASLENALSVRQPLETPDIDINIFPTKAECVNGYWSSRAINQYSQPIRACLNQLVPVTEGSILIMSNPVSGIDFAYGIYEGDSTASSGYSGWIPTSEARITLNFNGHLFVQFRKHDDSRISPDEVTVNVSVNVLSDKGAIENLTSNMQNIKEQIRPIVVFDASDAEVHQVNTSSTVENPNGTRLRVLYPVEKGAYVTIQGTYNQGVTAYVYATRNNAIYALTDGQLQVIKSSYTTDEFSASILFDGYLLISFGKTDGTAITAEEKSQFLNNLTVSLLGADKNKISNVEEVYRCNNTLSNGTIANPANTNAVCTNEYVFVFEGDSVYFETNKPLKYADGYYSYGYDTYDSDYNLVRRLNYTASTKSNAINIEDGESYVRFVICEYSSTFGGAVPNRITDYYGYDVVTRVVGMSNHLRDYASRNNKETKILGTAELNSDMESALIAMSGYNTFKSGNSSSATGYKKNFSLAVITDIHGSSTAFNRFIDYVNTNKKYFDIALCTGDIVQFNPAYDVSWFTSKLQESEVPFLFVPGNHDVADTGSAGITQAEARTKYFTEMESKGWILSSEFMGTDKCSWVKDFEDYSIRVISLFEYGNSVTIQTGAPGSYCRRWMDSELLQWFADTLYNTPTGYSVLVLLHQVPNNQVSYIDDKFTAVHGLRAEPPHFLNTMNGNPVEDIVNAFIKSTSINESYTSNSYIPGKTASVSKDFTSRAENGKFICYLCGHAHTSYVLQSSNYAEQKIIVVNTGSENMYQRSYSDTNYEPDSRNKDCFYCVGINTDRRTINLVQIGGQETADMRRRDSTAIQY